MLGVSPEEYRSSPWWRQQLIVNGIMWENENGGIYPRNSAGAGAGGGGQREFTDLSNASEAELAAMGLGAIQQW